jgi:hypothetical protein
MKVIPAAAAAAIVAAVVAGCALVFDKTIKAQS